MIDKNGFIYIIGGELYRTVKSAKKEASNLVFVFDVRLKTLTSLNSMNNARTHFTACELNGKIYVSGGRTENGMIRECEVFDIKKNSWQKIRPRFLDTSHFLVIYFRTS